ncbi:Non-specific lipid transfer protein GPI-anchored 14 [Stylosanthes scabra]|uniref:Non-specific lipid transfer protein GPI-anchored 14 n=1 Tax=Stylosanthes scabra TaxID=79078 RepID=A0ABU6QAJ2_9FABA|nr:Non-specific lipid transfer protein GPI-anchored 14 [Stylosanthes scabra]
MNCRAYTLLLAIVVIVGSAMGDSSNDKDKEECTQQLAGLATCLPYVGGGGAKAPTPDCCNGLKQVLKNSKKCLCLIIKDRNDPNLGGLQINVTLALGLPTVCNAPANISKCPELLHMDPKSPEAQVFYQSEKNGTSLVAPAPSVAISPARGKGESKGTSSKETSSARKNETLLKDKMLFNLAILGFGLQIVVLFFDSETAKK